MSEGRTVRVRIAAAVDVEGNWAAAGKSGHRDTDNREMVFLDDLKEGESWHSIEADIPIPVATTILGAVVPSADA